MHRKRKFAVDAARRSVYRRGAPVSLRCVGQGYNQYIRCVFAHGALCFDMDLNLNGRENGPPAQAMIGPGQAIPLRTGANDNVFSLNGRSGEEDGVHERWRDAIAFIQALNEDDDETLPVRQDTQRPIDYVLMRSVLALSNAIAEDGTLADPSVIGTFQLVHGAPHARRHRAHLEKRPRFLSRRKCGRTAPSRDPQMDL